VSGTDIRIVPVTVPLAVRVNRDGTVSPVLGDGLGPAATGGDVQRQKIENIVNNLENLILWVRKKKTEVGTHYGTEVQHVEELLSQAAKLAQVAGITP
jgi:hypothetical protein